MELQSSILSVKFPEVMLYSATNGKSGLELFMSYSPDIVITDINMSGMCGVQMAHDILKFKPDTWFIAITGYSEELVKQDISNNNFKFDHIIIKPVSLIELFSVVEQCIAVTK